MTSGQDIWQLTSVEYPAYISAIGRVFSPPSQNDALLSYVFLRLNFNCTTGASLIELYTGLDMGLTFIYQPYGYSDVFIEDFQGRRYLVTLIGSCWLAAPLPSIRAQDRYFNLHFKSLPPFRVEPQLASTVNLEKIVFVSERDGNPEIYTMKGDGSLVSRLTNHPARDFQPNWSPNRQFIAFTSERDGDAEIYRIDPGSEGLLNLTNNPSEDRHPTWSPDGQALAFDSVRSGNWEIYTMQADGANPRNLTNHPEADTHPDWSPDGGQIVFQSHRDGNWEIYLLNLASGRATRLTDHPADDLAPSWSPDGRWIAFWSQRFGSWGLYLAAPDGSQLRPLLQFVNPGSDPGRPSWSPDGRNLIFAIQQGDHLQLFQISADGSNVRRLTSAPSDDYQPDW
jgi:TolB protein